MPDGILAKIWYVATYIPKQILGWLVEKFGDLFEHLLSALGVTGERIRTWASAMGIGAAAFLISYLMLKLI